jgi:hypothetical protein
MPDRVLTLAQVVGNLKQAREASNRAGTALRGGLKDQHVTGLNRTFTPDDDDQGRLQKNPNEYKAVALTVTAQLAEDAAVTARALDWALTQDVTNCTAKADVIVNGEVILAQVPISHLLHLEKVFSEYKAVILQALPVLDPTKDWTWDEVRKLWKSRPEKTNAIVRREEPVVLHPGTEKHAPQAVLAAREVHIGEWEAVVWSGAVSEDQKRQLLARADVLIAALKDAIAVADHAPAAKMAEGDKLFGFLLGHDLQGRLAGAVLFVMRMPCPGGTFPG